MPTPVPAGLKLGLVEPVDAIAAFEKRKLLKPSYAWQDVFQEEHGRGFAVAGVQRLDVLQIFQDEIDSAIKNGTSLADYSESILPKLTAKGWWGDIEVTDPVSGEKRITKFDSRRLKLIYDVNMRQAFAAGRWKRIEATKARLPFLVYFTMQDEHVRASHRRWNALVLPVDHPFWDTHYPPNGWNCRCYAYAIDAKGIEKLRRAGVKIQTTPPADDDIIPFINRRTGEITPVPRGIDPGFAYNPGKERDAALHEAMLRKALKSPPLAGATAVAQATADYPAFVPSATKRFSPFVSRVLKAGQPAGEVKFLGAMPPAVVRGLATQGIEPVTAVIAVKDADVLAALKPAAGGNAVAVAESLYGRLPELMARATAVLLDKAAPAGGQLRRLVYVVELTSDAGEVTRLAIHVDLPLKGGQADTSSRQLLNLVRNATVTDIGALRNTAKFQLLWGALA